MTRSTTGSAGLALRARIVLLAAAGTPNQVIADRVQVSRPTVNKWRLRFAEQGLAGLADEPRPGPAPRVDQRRVIIETLTPPPARLGVTHWTSRLLAARLKTSHVTVAAAWKKYGVRPWRAETFKFSTDPELVAKVIDVIGLYLNPPEHIRGIPERQALVIAENGRPIIARLSRCIDGPQGWRLLAEQQLARTQMELARASASRQHIRAEQVIDRARRLGLAPSDRTDS